MRWPTPQDYNEAIQNPSHNFGDEELRTGSPALDALGLPRPITGAFASVYKVDCPGRSVAVRCFLRRVPDQQERYRLVSDFVLNDKLPYTVDFAFIDKGIKVSGAWFPVLKMEWVDGILLSEYVEHHLENSEKLFALADGIEKMLADLKDDGIAHGDLQHGNIMLSSDELRLVDYDGMFVPRLAGFKARELGHRNYQHPERAVRHFGPFLDNFSAWILLSSIRAAAIDPFLWLELEAGDESLLFREQDFKDPLRSPAFHLLESHGDARVRKEARIVRSLLALPPDMVPPPGAIVDSPEDLPALIRLDARPDWLESHRSPARTASAGKPAAPPTKLAERNNIRLIAKSGQNLKGAVSTTNPSYVPSPEEEAVASIGAGLVLIIVFVAFFFSMFARFGILVSVSAVVLILCAIAFVGAQMERGKLKALQQRKNKGIQSNLPRWLPASMLSDAWHLAGPRVRIFLVSALLAVTLSGITFARRMGEREAFLYAAIIAAPMLLWYAFYLKRFTLGTKTYQQASSLARSFKAGLLDVLAGLMDDKHPVRELVLSAGLVAIICAAVLPLTHARLIVLYVSVVAAPVLVWFVFYLDSWLKRYRTYKQSVNSRQGSTQTGNTSITTNRRGAP